MVRSSVVVGFIFIVSYGLLCYGQPLNQGDPSLVQGLGQTALFRLPMPDPRPDQGGVDFSPNLYQNLIDSSASLQHLPNQMQSQRINYAPVPIQSIQTLQSQGLIYPQQTAEAFSQSQQKPIPGPILDPVLEEEVLMEPQFEPSVPVPANTVEVHCGEASVKVLAQQDFLGNHQLINPADLSLGGCPSVGLDDQAKIIAFESPLQGCGSTSTMTEDSLVYSFALVYSPSPVFNTPIVKNNEAMVAIHCIYPRKHNVSSNALSPTWIPFAAMRAVEEHLHFSLKLMTNDWMYERPSNAYFMGDLINLEASVVRANHIPLRVFVESCVASSGPSGDSTTTYTFIENSGCMVDAKLTNSRSRFMARIHDDKLHFQIESFKFKQDSNGLIYITCHLKATAASNPTDVVNKACSFATETHNWVAASGDDQVCGCCETSCAMRKARSLDFDDSTFEDEATIGPIFIQELIEDEPLLQIESLFEESSKDTDSSVEFVLIMCLVVASGILCIIILGMLFYQRRQKRFPLTYNLDVVVYRRKVDVRDEDDRSLVSPHNEDPVSSETFITEEISLALSKAQLPDTLETMKCVLVRQWPESDLLH